LKKLQVLGAYAENISGRDTAVKLTGMYLVGFPE
jgi:hypothetical protein